MYITFPIYSHIFGNEAELYQYSLYRKYLPTDKYFAK